MKRACTLCFFSKFTFGAGHKFSYLGAKSFLKNCTNWRKNNHKNAYDGDSPRHICVILLFKDRRYICIFESFSKVHIFNHLCYLLSTAKLYGPDLFQTFLVFKDITLHWMSERSTGYNLNIWLCSWFLILTILGWSLIVLDVVDRAFRSNYIWFLSSIWRLTALWYL